MRLRGRATTPDKRRECTLSFGTRGAKQTTLHGPLQRLLGVTLAAFGATGQHLFMRHNAGGQEEWHDILPKRQVLGIPTYVSTIIELKRGVR